MQLWLQQLMMVYCIDFVKGNYKILCCLYGVIVLLVYYKISICRVLKWSCETKEIASIEKKKEAIEFCSSVLDKNIDIKTFAKKLSTHYPELNYLPRQLLAQTIQSMKLLYRLVTSTDCYGPLASLERRIDSYGIIQDARTLHVYLLLLSLTSISKVDGFIKEASQKLNEQLHLSVRTTTRLRPYTTETQWNETIILQLAMLYHPEWFPVFAVLDRQMRDSILKGIGLRFKLSPFLTGEMPPEGLENVQKLPHKLQQMLCLLSILEYGGQYEIDVHSVRWIEQFFRLQIQSTNTIYQKSILETDVVIGRLGLMLGVSSSVALKAFFGLPTEYQRVLDQELSIEPRQSPSIYLRGMATLMRKLTHFDALVLLVFILYHLRRRLNNSERGYIAIDVSIFPRNITAPLAISTVRRSLPPVSLNQIAPMLA